MKTDKAPNPMASLGWTLHSVGLASLLAGAVLFYAFFYAPLEFMRMRNVTRARTLEVALRDEAGARATHSALLAELADVERRAGETLARIPNQSREAEFFQQVTQLAETVGLVIEDYRRGEITAGARVAQMEIQLAGKAPYAGVCQFLDQLGHLPRLVAVREATIQSGNNAALYPLALTLVLYFDAPKDRSTEDG